MQYKLFSENEIKKIYETSIKLPPSYFNKYHVVPDCPVKSWNYQWNDRDCPRILTLLDFMEWVVKYNIKPDSLACTYPSDPELEFLSYNKLF